MPYNRPSTDNATNGDIRSGDFIGFSEFSRYTVTLLGHGEVEKSSKRARDNGNLDRRWIDDRSFLTRGKLESRWTASESFSFVAPISEISAGDVCELTVIALQSSITASCYNST